MFNSKIIFEGSKNRKFWAYALLSMLPPWIPILFFLTNNFFETGNKIFLLGIIFSLAELIFYIISLLFLRDKSKAFAISQIIFILILLHKPYCHLLYFCNIRSGITVSSVIIFSCVFILIVRKIKIISCKCIEDFVFIWSILVLLLFLFNMVNFFLFLIPNLRFVKKHYEYHASKCLPHPNIYWIHCDGMLSFDAIEKYYQESQTEFKHFLERHGFAIYKSAFFEGAHSTRCAFTALTCPKFYDEYLKGKLETLEKASDFSKNLKYYDSTLAYRRLCENELYLSFEKKGYTLFQVYDSNNAFFSRMTANDFLLRYRKYSLNGKGQFQANGIVAFLSMYFDYVSVRIIGYLMQIPDEMLPGYHKTFKQMPYKNSLFQNDYFQGRIPFVYKLNLISKIQSPRLVMIYEMGAHCPFIYDKNGNATTDSSDHLVTLNPFHYLPQHIFITKMIRLYIQMILSFDPDAIIIVQGDHGIHCCSEESIKAAFGNQSSAIELWNSVVSAVRIPAKYRNGNESVMNVTPLNISRYLINSFVGPNNCKYIEKEEKNVY